MSFALRLRCGTGDHYMGDLPAPKSVFMVAGGTVGLLNPERMEVQPGDQGQLATILDLALG